MFEKYFKVKVSKILLKFALNNTLGSMTYMWRKSDSVFLCHRNRNKKPWNSSLLQWSPSTGLVEWDEKRYEKNKSYQSISIRSIMGKWRTSSPSSIIISFELTNNLSFNFVFFFYNENVDGDNYLSQNFPICSII